MKRCSVIFTETFICFISLSALALTPPLPTPKCFIKGVIKNVEFLRATTPEDNCPKSNAPCPPPIGRLTPDRYKLGVEIHQVSYEEGDTSFMTCEKMFRRGKVEIITINKTSLKPGDTFKVGQTISGSASGFYQRYFDSYETLGRPK